LAYLNKHRQCSGKLGIPTLRGVLVAHRRVNGRMPKPCLHFGQGAALAGQLEMSWLNSLAVLLI
jgi:hypothetical protein